MANKEEKLRVRADEKFVSQMDAYIEKRNEALTEHKMTRSSLIREAVRAWIKDNPASKVREQRAVAAKYGGDTIKHTRKRSSKVPGDSKKDGESEDPNKARRQ